MTVLCAMYDCAVSVLSHCAGILGTIVLLVLILILIVLGKKIRISIAIIKEASK